MEVVEKLKTMNIKYQIAVKTQNLRVMKNAVKAELNLDRKLIFTPDILYLAADTATPDIEAHNRLIFDNLKPRIK